MKPVVIFTILLSILIPSVACNKQEKVSEVKIIFLHHSTGRVLWGGRNSIISKIAWRTNTRLYNLIDKNAYLPMLFENYNEENSKNYVIKKQVFPNSRPYGWNNFPYDYYNLWVRNAGDKPYMKEPTLEMLTKEYEVIIFKHCFPVSNISADQDSADINTWVKTISNYKLQYDALRDKLHEFPDTKFILFTGAAQVKANIKEDEARRAQEFFGWVKNDWNLPGDNIYLWDLYSLETEGSLYFRDEYAVSPGDSHPNKSFAEKVSGLLFNRIIDVIENDGRGTQLTGEKN